MSEHNLNSSQIAVIIPARYASTRLPEKMLFPIAGKPLIQWTYEAAAQAFGKNCVHILTDHDSIYHIAEQFGARVWMSPSECESGTARLSWALNHPLQSLQAQWIIGLQGDEPLLDMRAVIHSLKALQNCPEAVLSTLSTPINHEDFYSPHVVKCVCDQDGKALYFSRGPIPNPGSHKLRQEVPPIAKRHVGVYIWQKDFLKNIYPTIPSSQLQLHEDLEQLKLLEAGFHIQLAHWPHPIAAGIDTLADALAAQAILNSSSQP